MSYAIDLSPRQSSRTLEQAVRHKAVVLLEPRIWSDVITLTCTMEERSRQASNLPEAGRFIVLCCELNREDNASLLRAADQSHASDVLDAFRRLVGTYCDLAIQLGEHVFLASADVVKVDVPPPQADAVRIWMAAPATLQVAQRRRFRRIQLAESCRVWLRSLGEKEATHEDIGWLCNISSEGLACRVDAATANRTWIGDRLHVIFTLTPTDMQRFAFDAVVCNKTPAGTEGKMILGLEFTIDAEHAESTALSEALRKRLWSSGTLIRRIGEEPK